MTDIGNPESPSEGAKEGGEEGQDVIEVVDPDESEEDTLTLNKVSVCRR